MTIRIQVPMLRRGPEAVDRFTLIDWERMTANELSPAKQQEARKAALESDEPLQTRADVIDVAKAELGAEVECSTRLIHSCLAALLSITALTDAQLGAEAPNMSKLPDTLRAMEQVLVEAIAAYLSQVEPHSPTPYLLRRAVNWGRMPLPELMAQIIRGKGDLNRLADLLGLNG